MSLVALTRARRASDNTILYDDRVWSYAAVVLGAAVLALGVARHFFKRKSRGPQGIDMGQLSDSWLAEQRGNRDQSP